MPAVPHILEAEVRAAYEASTITVTYSCIVHVSCKYSCKYTFLCLFLLFSKLYICSCYIKVTYNRSICYSKKPAKYVSYSLRLPSYVLAVISVTVCMSILYNVCPLPSNVPLKFHGFQPSAPALDISMSDIRI